MRLIGVARLARQTQVQRASRRSSVGSRCSSTGNGAAAPQSTPQAASGAQTQAAPRGGAARQVAVLVLVAGGAGGAWYAWKCGLLNELGLLKKFGLAGPTAQEIAVAAAAAAAAQAAAQAAAAEEAARKMAAEESARRAAEQALAEAHAAEAERMAAVGAVASEAASGMFESVERSLAVGSERRAIAEDTLKAALAANDLQALIEALALARSAGLGATADVKFAESIAEPVHFIREGLRSSELEELLLLPAQLRGLSPEGAEAAELKACENFDREQLEARVVELARSLAAGRLHAKSRLEQALLTRLEQADMASLQDLGNALQRIAEQREQLAMLNLTKLKSELEQAQAVAVAQVQQDAVNEVQQLMDNEVAELETIADEVLTEERSQRLSEVVSLSKGLADVVEVVTQDAVHVQRAQAYNNISMAVLGLEDAIVSGRGAQVELEVLRVVAGQSDGFVDGILQQLPKDCADLCRRKEGVPTEPLLRQQLAARLDELAAAALTPPNSGLLGELVGRALRKLYILDPDALPRESIGGMVACSATAEASHNLAVLSRSRAAVAAPADGGVAGLEVALAHLEGGLGGLCRERAASWLEEARTALLLRQAIRAVKARVQCLSAASVV